MITLAVVNLFNSDMNSVQTAWHGKLLGVIVGVEN